MNILTCLIGSILLIEVSIDFGNAQTPQEQSCTLKNNIQGKCQPKASCLEELNHFESQEMQELECGSLTDAPLNQTICCPVVSQSFVNRISDTKCKEFKPEIDNRIFPNRGHITIVKGKLVTFGDFPHMAAIGCTTEDETDWHCGGSLISLNYVMTAAHCTLSNNQPPNTVRLGALDLITTTNDELHVQNFKVSQIIRHPRHRFSSLYHDIALIKLDRNVLISKSVRPACISASDFNDHSIVFAIGYGQIEFAGKRSNNLQKILLERYQNNECVLHFEEPTRQMPNGLISGQLCAADRYSLKDTCQGDSGGPLLLVNGTTHYVVGITSFGKGCAAATPSVYTKVSEYIEWIESVVW